MIMKTTNDCKKMSMKMMERKERKKKGKTRSDISGMCRGKVQSLFLTCSTQLSMKLIHLDHFITRGSLQHNFEYNTEIVILEKSCYVFIHNTLVITWFG